MGFVWVLGVTFRVFGTSVKPLPFLGNCAISVSECVCCCVCWVLCGIHRVSAVCCVCSLHNAFRFVPFLACPFREGSRSPSSIGTSSTYFLLQSADCAVSYPLPFMRTHHNTNLLLVGIIFTPEARPRRPPVSSGLESVCVHTKSLFFRTQSKGPGKAPLALGLSSRR